MLALLAGAVFGISGQPPSHLNSGLDFSGSVQQEETRLRTILPNGSVVYVIKNATSPWLTLQFFVSSRSAPDTAKRNGYRHVWEHLVAKGRTHRLDETLESQGAFLTAQTYREATVFQIVLRPQDLKIGLDAVHALTELGELSQDAVVKESAIIAQEIGLESDSRKLSQDAWKAAYGDEGLDPYGEPSIIAAASPSALLALHKSLMVGHNLTLVIEGQVDLDGATGAASEALGTVPAGPLSLLSPRKFLGGGVGSSDASGSALAVPVIAWNAPSTAARLAAALAIAANQKNSFVTYTPSLEGSLIIVGRTGDSASFSSSVAKTDPNGMFGLGRALAHRWVDQQESTNEDGVLTGLLISEGAGQRVKTMHDNLDRMTVAEFRSAYLEFAGRGAVEILGR